VIAWRAAAGRVAARVKPELGRVLDHPPASALDCAVTNREVEEVRVWW
jgi:hypothetical protein